MVNPANRSTPIDHSRESGHLEFYDRLLNDNV